MASTIANTGFKNEVNISKLKIFISYSRADMAFADELVAGLEYDGRFDAMIDREGIHEGDDWKGQLGDLIAKADTVVFILSPRSAVSKVCQWEVDEAERLSKRILPVLAAPLEGALAPNQLAALHYVRFDEGRSFMGGLATLRTALNTDLEWLHEHTRILNRAMEWDLAGRPDNRLFSGSDISAAKAWLDTPPKAAPSPTELHRDFIKKSDEAEILHMSSERQRAKTLTLAVRRTKTALVGTLLFALGAAGAGLYAYQKAREAEASAQAAKASAQKSEELAMQLAQIQRARLARNGGFGRDDSEPKIAAIEPVIPAGPSEPFVPPLPADPNAPSIPKTTSSPSKKPPEDRTLRNTVSAKKKARFVGEAKFEFSDNKQKVRLLSTLMFVDKSGKTWKVPVNTVSTAATIPVSISTVLGSPLRQPKYLKAVVLHEYYAAQRIRSTEKVNLMFYEALLTSGVNNRAARYIYGAVESFGPKWGNAKNTRSKRLLTR